MTGTCKHKRALRQRTDQLSELSVHGVCPSAVGFHGLFGLEINYLHDFGLVQIFGLLNDLQNKKNTRDVC